MSSNVEEVKMDSKAVTEINEEEEGTLREFLKFLKEYLELEEKAAEVQKYACDHPVLSVFLAVTIAMCSGPVICFMLFVFGSIAFSVAGFVFVEGTLVFVGAVILIGVLFLVTLMAIGVSIFFICAYFAVQFGREAVHQALEYFSSLNKEPVKEE